MARTGALVAAVTLNYNHSVTVKSLIRTKFQQLL